MNTQQFVNRHISLNESDKAEMLKKVGAASIEELISQTIPDAIRLQIRGIGEKFLFFNAFKNFIC